MLIVYFNFRFLECIFNMIWWLYVFVFIEWKYVIKDEKLIYGVIICFYYLELM